MTGPAWLAAGLAGLMILVAACCAGRLAIAWLRARGTELDADGLHVLMGTAMAGMLEPRLRVLPAAVWLALFAGAAAWFGWQAIRAHSRMRRTLSRCAHPAPHAVECLAMIYMLVPATRAAGHGPAMAMPAMAGSAGAAVSNPALPLILALVMLGSILWTTDRFASSSRHAGTGDAPAAAPAIATTPGTPGRFTHLTTVAAVRPALAPRLAVCAKIMMSITMGYMLLTMV